MNSSFDPVAYLRQKQQEEQRYVNDENAMFADARRELQQRQEARNPVVAAPQKLSFSDMTYLINVNEKNDKLKDQYKLVRMNLETIQESKDTSSYILKINQTINHWNTQKDFNETKLVAAIEYRDRVLAQMNAKINELTLNKERYDTYIQQAEKRKEEFPKSAREIKLLKQLQQLVTDCKTINGTEVNLEKLFPGIQDFLLPLSKLPPTPPPPPPPQEIPQRSPNPLPPSKGKRRVKSQAVEPPSPVAEP